MLEGGFSVDTTGFADVCNLGRKRTLAVLADYCIKNTIHVGDTIP
jgi:hypothetical protein